MPPVATTVQTVPLSKPDLRRLRTLARQRKAKEAEIAEAIVEMRDKGGSLREIAEALDMSHGGVAWIERRMRGEDG